MGEGISPLDESLKYLKRLIWVPNRHLRLNIVKMESLIFSITNLFLPISVKSTTTYPAVWVKTELPFFIPPFPYI